MNDRLESIMEQQIFCGLNNLNNGFDSPNVKHFSYTDFKIVIERINKSSLFMMGIEAWSEGKFYDVLTYEDFDVTIENRYWYNWAVDSFHERKEDLLYSATFTLR